jgi:serine/threonine-protein kinase RIO1
MKKIKKRRFERNRRIINNYVTVLVISRNHIVIMELIGVNGVPAPRLANVIMALQEEEKLKIYWDCVTLLRRLHFH